MLMSTTIGDYFNLHMLWLSIWESESPDLKRERHTRLHRRSDRRGLHQRWSERCRLRPRTIFVTRSRRLSSTSSIRILLRRTRQQGEGCDGNRRTAARSGSLSWLHLIPSRPLRNRMLPTY